MIDSGRAARPVGRRPADRRQALDRRRRRQGLARAVPARRGVRRGRAAAVGRGLGHTGGTLDKLESIPGWRADARRRRRWSTQLQTVGASSRRRAPAWRRPTASSTRCATSPATVESHPADRQLDHVEEDRRGHRGARARREGRVGCVHADARRRAPAGRDDGRLGDGATACAPPRCSPTMDTPLGRACGNALEVTESIEMLAGRAARPTSSRSPSRSPTRCWRWPASPRRPGARPRRRAPPSGVARDGARRRAATSPPACRGHVHAGRPGVGDGLRHAARRPRRRRVRVAARRGPIPQGGPGQRVGRRRVPGQAGRRRRGGPARPRAAHRRRRPRAARPRGAATAPSGSARAAAAPAARHRRDPAPCQGTARMRHERAAHPTTADAGGRRRSSCTTTSTAGCGRRRSSSWPREYGYAQPAHDRRRTSCRAWFHRGAKRNDLVLYLETFAHTRRRHAAARRHRAASPPSAPRTSPPTASSTPRCASPPSCTSRRGLTLDEVVEAVLEGFRLGSAGTRPHDLRAAVGHAHRGPQPGDRRAGRALARRRRGRLRHRRRRGRLPAHPPPRRVPVRAARELPRHDPRRRGVRAAVDLGGAAVVRRRAPRPRRAHRRRHHRRATASTSSVGWPPTCATGASRSRCARRRTCTPARRRRSPSTRSGCCAGCASASRSTPTTG